MDRLIGIPYTVRGIRTGEGWEYPVLTYDDIQQLKTPFFYNSVRLYNDFKMFGLPHGKGYMKENSIVMEILRILEDEGNGFDMWEMEQKRN